MKKLLIALLALGTLSFVPEAEAKGRCGKKRECAKKECPEKPACAPKCGVKKNCPTRDVQCDTKKSVRREAACPVRKSVEIPREQDVYTITTVTTTTETHEELGDLYELCEPACVPCAK